jgi:hypothetical protein
LVGGGAAHLLNEGVFFGWERISHCRRELIVACVGGFSPGEPRAHDFGDVVACTGITHVRLRRQIRHLGYEHCEIVPTVNMMVLRTNRRGRGFWFHLRRGQLAFFYLRRGQLAFFSFFFYCLSGTKREFFFIT